MLVNLVINPPIVSKNECENSRQILYNQQQSNLIF